MRAAETNQLEKWLTPPPKTWRGRSRSKGRSSCAWCGKPSWCATGLPTRCTGGPRTIARAWGSSSPWPAWATWSTSRGAATAAVAHPHRDQNKTFQFNEVRRTGRVLKLELDLDAEKCEAQAILYCYSCTKITDIFFCTTAFAENKPRTAACARGLGELLTRTPPPELR